MLELGLISVRTLALHLLRKEVVKNLHDALVPCVLEVVVNGPLD